MGRAPRAVQPQALSRTRQRMAPGGRMWGESPIRELQNDRLLLRGAGLPPEQGTLTSVVTRYGNTEDIGAPPAGVRAGYALIGMRSSAQLPIPPAGWETLATWQWPYTGVVLCRRLGSFTGPQVCQHTPTDQTDTSAVYFVGGDGGTFLHSTTGPVGQQPSPVSLPPAPAPAADVWARIMLLQNVYSSLAYDAARIEVASAGLGIGAVSPRRGTWPAADAALTYAAGDYSPANVTWSSIGAWGQGNGISVAVGWAA